MREACVAVTHAATRVGHCGRVGLRGGGLRVGTPGGGDGKGRTEWAGALPEGGMYSIYTHALSRVGPAWAIT